MWRCSGEVTKAGEIKANNQLNKFSGSSLDLSSWTRFRDDESMFTYIFFKESESVDFCLLRKGLVKVSTEPIEDRRTWSASGECHHMPVTTKLHNKGPFMTVR